jgi:outer membrane receptor protein involved in Fe transport
VNASQSSRTRSIRIALVLGVLGSSTALAQIGTSNLIGNVVDASTKAPVADVVVTATSPTLQGEQVVVTDSTGAYRVPQLPPGTYTLRFEKETFRPYSRTAIDVGADRTLRLNVELLPETAGEATVTVVGSPPTVDVGSSTNGTRVDQDFIRNLAVARPGGLAGANRSFDSLALAAPQASADVYGISISGGQSPENQYLIDGLSVNNPAYGTLGSPLPADFIDEVNVLTGGYMPEYGRSFGGGTISATTKTGGNEFHGSIFGTWTPGGLSGAARTVQSQTATISSAVNLSNIGDVGATLGGYIIKDKLWFFGGFDYARQRYSYTRSFNTTTVNADGSKTITPIDNSTQRRFGDEKTISYIGKLTFQASQDHRFSLTVSGEPTTGGGSGAYALRTTYGSANRGITSSAALANTTFNANNLSTNFDNLDLVGEYNGSFLDKKLLLQLVGGWHHQEDDILPGDGSTLGDIGNASTLAGVSAVRTPTGARASNITAWDAGLPSSVYAACGTTFSGAGDKCPVSGYFFGGPGFLNTSTLDSYQGKGVLTYLLTGLGHHVLKAGGDYEHMKYHIVSTYSGYAAYRTLGGPHADGAPGMHGFYVYDYRRYGVQTDVDTIDPSLAGATTDKVVNSDIFGVFAQDSWSIMDKVTLNVGLRYDTLSMKDNLGRVGAALNDQWSPRIGVVWDPTQQGRAKIYANYGRYYENIPLDAANRSLSAETQIRALHACDPMGGHANCDANLRSAAPLGGGLVSSAWLNTGAPYPTPVDPNLKSPSTDEVVAGGEYEVLANARVGASYTYRNLVRTVEDMSTTGGFTYFLGNPGEGIGSVFPKATRKYNAVTVFFTKTFSDLWLAQVSYTWSRLTGNYDGLFAPNYGPNQLDPNITALFDFPQFIKNAEGNLGGDITHVVKIFLAKEFVITPVFSFSLGGSFNASSGFPIEPLGSDPVYGDGIVYLLQRGTTSRTPWVTSFDAKVGINYRLTKDSVITAAVEGFNLFNSQRPTQIDQRYTLDFPGPILGPGGVTNPGGATQGTIPTNNGYGAIVNTDPTKGPVYDPTAPYSANAPGVIRAANGTLPTSKTGSLNVLLPDPAGNTIIVATNPNWAQATSFQAVRQFRFSLRVTF